MSSNNSRRCLVCKGMNISQIIQSMKTDKINENFM